MIIDDIKNLPFDDVVKIMIQLSTHHATTPTHRRICQKFYKSHWWEIARKKAIVRDNGCEFGNPRYPIYGPIYVHHINPVTEHDLQVFNPNTLDLNNLTCVSKRTHDAITFKNPLLIVQPTTRTQGDTKLW